MIPDISMKKYCLILFTAGLFICISAIPALSSTVESTFDGGSENAIFDPVEPPGITLPAGCVVFHASVDLTGKEAFTDQNVLLNFNDTGVEGWYGVSAENPPVSRPDGLEKNAFDAHDRTKLDSNDGDYFRCLADGGTGDGPYQHFSFSIDSDPSLISNIHVLWKGRGEEPLIDTFERYKSDIYVRNTGQNTWERLMGYGVCGEHDLQTLEKDITANFGRYIDDNEKLHLLARAWVWGTMEAYLDTDYIELNVTFAGGSQYASDPVLRLAPGGETVWTHDGAFTSKVTLGDGVLTGPIQALSDEALDGGEDYFTVRFLLEYSGHGVLEFSNLSMDYGMPPTATKEFIEVLMDEDSEAESVIDLHDLFSDDGPSEDLTFEIIREEDDDKVDARIEDDGHSMSFSVDTEHWYGEMDFGIKVTDTDGLSLDYSNITVSVRPVNDDPVPLGLSDLTWFEDRDAPLDFLDLWDHFEDGGWMEDETQNLTFSLPGGSNPAYGDNTALGLILENRYFTCSPSENYNGKVNFTVEVHDTDDGWVRDSFAVVFEPLNDVPYFTSTPPLTADENSNFCYEIEGADIDGDALEITLLEGPKNMTIDEDELKWATGDFDVGVHNVSLKLSDGENSSYQNFTVTIDNINDAPLLAEIAPLEGSVGEELTWTFEAVDVDLSFDSSEKLTFTDDSERFDVDFETGFLSFVPHWTHIGVHTFNITVTDRLALEYEREVEMNISFPDGTETPGVRITSPVNGTTLTVGADTAFSAELDWEGGGDWTYAWYVNGKSVENHKKINVSLAKEGKHTVTVVACDGTGQVEHSVIVNGKIENEVDEAPGFGIMMVLFAVGGAMMMGAYCNRNRAGRN